MITLITGVPGSGKTLYAIGLIEQYLKDGRQVYADISGLKIEGVLPCPKDWRDTPHGSVLFYDECQREFPSSGKMGNSDDPRIIALETHRHTGHDIHFITQSPSLIHTHIRKLVGKHYHIYRAMGLKGATVYSWDMVCNTPNDKREHRTADVRRWTYPQANFAKYQSATVHTHKFQLPKKFILISAFIVAIISISIYLGKDTALAKGILGQSTSESTPPNPKSPNTSGGGVGGEYNNDIHNTLEALKPVTVFLSGCMSGKRCRCWDDKGAPVDIPQSQCLNMTNGSEPLAINLNMPEFGNSNSNNN